MDDNPVSRRIRMIEQENVSPALLDQVTEENDTEALAEVMAQVRVTVQEECEQRDLGKHAGIACLYMVIDHLADGGGYDE